jgi:hypothetical protein
MEHKLVKSSMVLVALSVFGCAALAGLGSGGSAGGGAASAGANAATASVIPKPSFFDFVGRSTKIRYLSPASLLADSTLVEAYLIEEQCAFETADPPFMVPRFQDEKGWTFAGRLNQGQTMQALEYRSLLLLGLWGDQQLNAWPVSLILMSDFPEAYLSDRLAMLAAVKLPPEQQKPLADRYIQDADQIRSTVQSVVRAYDRGECAP